MKKDILFVMPSLGAGGGEKSLVNLLSKIDYSKYNVDLFLINPTGLFMELVPNEVRVLDIADDLRIFNMKLCKSITKFISLGEISLAYNRLMFCIANRIIKNKAESEQYSWKYIRRAIGKINKKYDVSVGYLEKTSNYICVDNVMADRKIGWIHTDYNMLNSNKKFDAVYFNKLDFIVTVSEQCMDSLKKEFPSKSENVKLIKNIISPKIIYKMALENPMITIDENEKLIVSVGRLSNEKGFDIAIDACELLIKSGLKVKWYVVGEGPERFKLQKLIDEKELNQIFILLGTTTNPYKFINKSDVYVQPSRYEGKSMAIDEAKILCKPIVITNFSTSRDQIIDEKEGLVVEITPQDVCNGVKRLIEDVELTKSIVGNLKKLPHKNEEEINNLYKLID